MNKLIINEDIEFNPQIQNLLDNKKYDKALDIVKSEENDFTSYFLVKAVIEEKNINIGYLKSNSLELKIPTDLKEFKDNYTLVSVKDEATQFDNEIGNEIVLNLNKIENVEASLEKYSSNNKEERIDEILNTFIEDKLKGINIDNLEDTFKEILEKEGLLEINNPFIKFIKNYNKINTNLLGLNNSILALLYNLYIKGIIDENDLNGNSRDRLNNILFKPSLYNLSEEDIQFAIQTYLWFELTKDLSEYINNLSNLKFMYKMYLDNPKDINKEENRYKLRDFILYTKGKVNNSKDIKTKLNYLNKSKFTKQVDIDKEDVKKNLKDLVKDGSLTDKELEEFINELNNINKGNYYGTNY